MVVAVALTVVLPVAGLAASLAVITLLRAADRAQSALAVRRSVRGPRASDLVVVLVMAPLTVARALLTEAFMAPLALTGAAAAYAATVVLTHSANMPRAGAYAAAAFVAWYGLGPGSGRPRRQLNRMAGVLARTPAWGGGARRGGGGAAQRDHVSGELAAKARSLLTPRRGRPAASA
jgi:hypothetical protein